MAAIALAFKAFIKNITTVYMSRQDFHATPIIPINRDVSNRLGKVAKLLKTPMLTHLEVAVVRFYENGKEIVWRINGNTRDEVWENEHGKEREMRYIQSGTRERDTKRLIREYCARLNKGRKDPNLFHWKFQD